MCLFKSLDLLHRFHIFHEGHVDRFEDSVLRFYIENHHLDHDAAHSIEELKFRPYLITQILLHLAHNFIKIKLGKKLSVTVFVRGILYG